MKKILVAQMTILVIITVLSQIGAGTAGGISALLGGLTYLIPSIISVLILKFFESNPALRSKAFIFGEILKVILSLVLMLTVFAVWHQSLIFIPFLLGLFGVSHLVFLVLLRVRDYGK